MDGLDKGMWPALLVALITWGGVFVYMLRLDRLTRDLEKQVNRLETEQAAAGLDKSEANAS